MQREVLLERFFNALISGQRAAAREIVDQLLAADCLAEKIFTHLFWPTLDQVQTLRRNDQMNEVAYHYATRMLRALVDQLQPRLEQAERRGKSVLIASGDEISEEIAGQMTTDLMEAAGFDVYFTGGGVANDDLVAQINALNVDTLVIFGAIPATVPYTRLLIDRLHDIGANQKMQIVIGGGVFNRAEGLAEEIGADLWAQTPDEVVRVVSENPTRRMTANQRSVGRKRRASARAAEAA